jgi:hypothetical protein
MYEYDRITGDKKEDKGEEVHCTTTVGVTALHKYTKIRQDTTRQDTTHSIL